MDMEKAQYWIIGLMIGIPLALILLDRFLTRGRRRKMMGQAEVLSKTPELAQGAGAWGNNNWNYKIQFRVGNAEFFLYVLLCDYETIQVGQTGTLIWQEQNLLEFTPDES